MLLYSTHITPRLRYIARFLGKELFDHPIALSASIGEFKAYKGPRINYSSTPLTDDEFFIPPTGLLAATGVTPVEVICFDYKGYPAFFPTQGDIPFDLPSAVFYLLSRYEEYGPHKKDTYGRFDHTQSVAFREKFLDIPLVNYWLVEFRKCLSEKYPDIIFRYASFKFVPTYDIDSAWSWLHKGFIRNTGGLLRSLLKGQWKTFSDRLLVLRGHKPDPFDAYEWLDSLHLYCRMKPYYFFLTAAQCKGVDKNISPDNHAMQDLISYHARGYRIGIHPSWQSGDNEIVLKEEHEWLEVIAGQPITRSRQHFIRFTLPETYRQLIKLGINQEFSMGYGSINGFRASVASSFLWYDLEREEETALRIFPFCFMDANAYYEQGYTAQQAMRELMHYYYQIRKVGGLMVTIWHNSFLGTDSDFAGWREVYEVFLKEEVFWDM